MNFIRIRTLLTVAGLVLPLLSREALGSPPTGKSKQAPPVRRYERDDAYWRKRLYDLAEIAAPSFRAPEIGTRITIIRRIGDSPSGTIEELSNDAVVIDGKKYRRSTLSSETCQHLFADDWAIAHVIPQVSTERQKYEAEERVKWQKEDRQAECIQQAIIASQNVKTYEESMRILSEAMNGNPTAPNLEDAKRLYCAMETGLNEYNLYSAKGLVKFRGRWMTPQQQLEQLAKDRYGNLASFWQNAISANARRDEEERTGDLVFRQYEAQLNLWNSSIAGPPIPGFPVPQQPGSPPATYQWHVIYDKDLNVYVCYPTSL